jgi:hypothetical protein
MCEQRRGLAALDDPRQEWDGRGTVSLVARANGVRLLYAVKGRDGAKTTSMSSFPSHIRRPGLAVGGSGSYASNVIAAVEGSSVRAISDVGNVM